MTHSEHKDAHPRGGKTPSGHMVDASSALNSPTAEPDQAPDAAPAEELPSGLSHEELEAKIVEAIKTVYDPEIPVNVYDLGLIYGIDILPDETVLISMTLTTPNCPAAGFLPGQVEQRVRHLREVRDARVEITFDPPFTPDMMSDEAKLELGFL